MAAAATMTRPTEQEGTPAARQWRALHHHGPDQPATQRVDVEWWYDLDQAARALARLPDQSTRKFGQKTTVRRLREAAALGDHGEPRPYDDPALIEQWKTRLIDADAAGQEKLFPRLIDRKVYFTLDEAAAALARLRPMLRGKFGLRTIQRLLHKAAEEGGVGDAQDLPAELVEWYRRALVEQGVFEDPGDLAPAD